jgi:hypothetical protein
MALIACPQCAASIAESAEECPKCGTAIRRSGVSPKRLIAGIGGKLQAAGVVLLAGGVIATVLGTWWGPAALLPGIVLVMMGKAA